MKWRFAALISLLPFAGALAGGPYDGTYSGQLQPGSCPAFRGTPMILHVLDNKADAQIVGLGGWSGNLDSSGNGSLMAVAAKNPRELSITVSGDTFEVHGHAACGQLRVIGKRAS